MAFTTRLRFADWGSAALGSAALGLAAPCLLASPSLAQVIPLGQDPQFVDISEHWANQCLEGMGTEKLMRGYGDRSFRPERTMTRAEFAAVMIQAFPEAASVRDAPNFRDVEPSFWGKDAIATAYKRGFLAGYPDNRFRPNQPISRVQAMVVIANAAHTSAEAMPTESAAVLQRHFDDSAAIPNYAQAAIAQATQRGFVVNYPDVSQLRPQAQITRGEATALLCRLNAVGTDARYYVPADYVANFAGEQAKLESPVVLLDKIPGGIAGYLHTHAALEDEVFFFINESVSGAEMWASDGTRAGTRLIRKLATTVSTEALPVNTSHPIVMANGDQRFWFAPRASQLGIGSTESWYSDGTATGTGLTASLQPELESLLSQGQIRSLTAGLLFQDRLSLFINTDEQSQLWLSDGASAAGTQRLAVLPATFSQDFPRPEQMAIAGDYFFFRAGSEQNSQLWRTDGTSAGTLALGSIALGKLRAGGPNRLYAQASTAKTGQEPWVSDGTIAGTQLLKDIYPGEESSSPQLLTTLNDSFLFVATSPSGTELWSTQGSPESMRLVTQLSAQRLSPVNDSAETQASFKRHQGKLFFHLGRAVNQGSTDSNTTGNDEGLWVTDGSAAGTQQLAAVRFPRGFSAVAFKDKLFFSGMTQDGLELWRSDGTASGTEQVIDLLPGIELIPRPCPPPPPELETENYCLPERAARSAQVRSLTVHGDFLYFIVDDRDLFRTDGTAQGMQHVKSFPGGPFRDWPVNLAKVDNNLFMMGNVGNVEQLLVLPE